MNYQDFISSGQDAIRIFDENTQNYSFLEQSAPDHVCYKCSGRKEFELIRSWFEEHGVFVYQAQISGRPIATIQLKKPFVSQWGEIHTLELSDQKPDGSQTSQWDHIEVKHINDDYNGLVAGATNYGLDVILKERPHHTTHEVKLGGSIKLVFTRERLIEKIKEEMG